MDTAQWSQGIVVRPIEEIVITNTCPKPNSSSSSANNNNNINNLGRKLTRPQKESALNCPRCNSTNTKFCYYNNYSLTQPRYFCKTCRRYWTDGGSLRNIPVGGGSRRNKRSSLPSSSTSTSSIITSSTPPPTSSNLSNKRLPDLIQHQGNNNQDLNLGFLPSNQVFTRHQGLDQNSEKNKSLSTTTTTTTTSASHLSAMELLNGLTSSRGLNSFLPMSSDPNDNNGSSHDVYSSSFPMSELMMKPSSLNFSLEGIGSGYGNSALQGQHGQENNGRLLFPFEDLKQVSDGGLDHHDHNNKEQLNHGGDSNGYWSGMLGGSW